MPSTIRGIYHNLKESEYTVSDSEIVFFFSSKLYRDKFLSDYEEHRETFLSKMHRLTGEIPLNMTTLADITLYRRIEKRGFRALMRGVDITWQDLNVYALRKMMLVNTNDWQEIQKPKLTERIKIMG